MLFVDMEGKEINIGDILEPVNGLKVEVVSRGFSENAGQEVLYGQQIENMDAFCILTLKNLKAQFRRV